MKKFFYLAAVALFSVSLVSCDDDDDNNDPKVKLIQKMEDSSRTVLFEYNTGNKVTSIKYSSNNELYSTMAFIYNADGTLNKSTLTERGNTSTITYTYGESTITAKSTSTDEYEPTKTEVLTLNSNDMVTKNVITYEGIYYDNEGNEKTGTFSKTYTFSYDANNNMIKSEWAALNPSGEQDNFQSGEFKDAKVDAKYSFIHKGSIPAWYLTINSGLNYNFLTAYANNYTSYYRKDGMFGGQNNLAYTYDEDGYPTAVYKAEEDGSILKIDGVEVAPDFNFTYIVK